MKNYYKQNQKFNRTSSLGKMAMLMGIVLLMCSFQSNSQTIVKVASGAILSDVINGDTTATGERNNANTIYELEMNGIYEVAAALSINSKLHIRSEGGEGFLPAIIAKKDDSNNWPKVINNKGDITLEGIYLSSANGDDANPKFGGLTAAGENSRVIIKDCQLEFDKAASVIFAAKGIKCYLENVVASKTGNYKEYNGNGRFVDTRGNKADTIVIKNSTGYYMQDRIIRNMGGELNYLEIDHVTIVNNQGFHGCFAMARVHHAKITNNLVINGMYGGDHPNVKEQTSTDAVSNEQIYMITMDTIYADTELEISNNNIAFTPDVLEFFNSIDSVSKPEVLAPIVKTVLGDKASAAYFEEAVEFTSMPDVPWDFLNSIYFTPGAVHPNNWPDEIGINNIDASYLDSYVSATASTTGGQVGDLNWPLIPTVGISTKNANNALSANVYPNPTNGTATFTYTLAKSSDVSLTVFDITGKVVKAINVSAQPAGTNELKWDGSELNRGLYLYTVKCNSGTVSGRITLN